jgi:AraC-like DNA-binding protein
VNVTVDWIHLVTLVGAAQGLLLAGGLLAHRSNRTANRLLAALMAAFTLYLVQEVYYSSGLVPAYPSFFGWSYPLPWVFGPLVYLYAVAASDGERRLGRRDALHFVPLIVVLIVGLPIYVMSGPEKIAFYDRLRSGVAPTYIRLIDPTKYVSGFAYSVATFAFLRRHRRSIENSYSSTERVNLRWLVRLSAGVVSIWLLALALGVSGIMPSTTKRSDDSLVALAIALLVYAIGYMGLRQPEIFHYDRQDVHDGVSPPRDDAEPERRAAGIAAPQGAVRAHVTAASKPADVVSTSAERANARYERYERSGLSDVEAKSLKAALIALMTKERPYRDPDLTLPALAERLDTTPHKLSEVLNTELSQTFYDFVNSYRVEEVRRRLAASESKHLNVLTLAMDAGFASKSTFNQVFKKQTGQTPSTYRKAGRSGHPA